MIVATNDERIAVPAPQQRYDSTLTRGDHATGADRIAEVAAREGLADDEIVVNVQGDEPLIEPALIRGVAEHLACTVAEIATAAHPVGNRATFVNPNVVKVVLDDAGCALYFYARVDSISARCEAADDTALPQGLPRCGMSVYTPIARTSQGVSAAVALSARSVQALERFVRSGTVTASRSPSSTTRLPRMIDEDLAVGPDVIPR